MNAFALRVLNLPQIVLILLAVGLMVVGAALAARTDTSDDRLARAPYFALATLTGLGLALAQIVWFVTGPALAGGWLWVLLLLQAGAFVLAGYVLFPFARARSRDGWGNAGMAFLTFIPIANLWLLFKPPQGGPAPLHGLSGGGGVLIGLVAVGATAWLNSAVPDAVVRTAARYQLQNPASEEASARMSLQAMGVEAVLADVAANSGTPRTIDQATVLQRIDAVGTRLVHTYTVVGDLDALPDDAAARLRAVSCPETGLKMLIEAGATMEHLYLRVDGSEIGRVVIDRTACGY